MKQIIKLDTTFLNGDSHYVGFSKYKFFEYIHVRKDKARIFQTYGLAKEFVVVHNLQAQIVYYKGDGLNETN